MNLTDFDIEGYSIASDPTAGITSVILYDYCATIADPSDAVELAAAITAGDAAVICVINGDKPVGSNTTKSVATACETKEIITGRNVTLNFDGLWSAANLATWSEINGKDTFKFAFVTCTSDGKGVMSYYDTKTTVSVDDEFTGNREDGTVRIKGVLTTKRKAGELLPVGYDTLSEALVTLVSCASGDCA